MWQDSCQKLRAMQDMASPAGAIEVMKTIAERAIIHRMERAVTREKAIAELSDELGLGSWLRRLVYGKPVADSASNLFKLSEALEKEIEAKQRRLEHDRALVEAINHSAPMRMFG